MSVHIIVNDMFERFMTPEAPVTSVAPIKSIATPKVIVLDDDLARWVSDHTCTIQHIIDAVASVSDFAHSITHEKALVLQQELNAYNEKHPMAQICVILGTNEGGCRWYYWGPNVSLTVDEAYEVCCIYRRYMTCAQREQFDAEMLRVYPFYDFVNATC